MKLCMVWLVIGAVVGLAPQTSWGLPSAPSAKDVKRDIETLTNTDEYYGVYVSGQKVGWMRSRLTLGKMHVYETQVRARITGMGQVADITLREVRTYDGKTNLLEKIEFVQTAATGEVKVQGYRKDPLTLRLDITAGGKTRTQDLPVDEHLSDIVASIRLAKGARPGAVVNAVHFDPSIQKVLRVELRVLATEKRNFAGVEVQTVKIKSTYPDVGVSETVWLDSHGKTLESQIGGMFVARLEPPDVAKRLDYSQDLLVSAVVRAPRRLVAPTNVQKLSLRFTGFGDLTPPSSTRQVVTREGDETQIVLQKDGIPKRSALGTLPDPTNTEVLEALAPTAFIQSDAPVLVAAAKKAVGEAKDAFQASNRLVEFVYKHIHSEYVPAFSNALEAYNSARGDCTEHSILFVALARAAKLPARVAVGIAYWPPGDGFGWHAWAEVFIDGRWIAVDPTWNQNIADATHVKLADGDPAQQARIVMLLGQLHVQTMQTL